MMQWTGDNFDDVAAFAPVTMFKAPTEGWLSFWCEQSRVQVQLYAGGWIARERDGNGFYPLSEADQVETYELVEGSE